MSENDVPVSNQSGEDIHPLTSQASPGGENSNGTRVPISSTTEIVDDLSIEDLDEALERYISQNRWSDVIRTTLAKAELVADTREKVALLVEAGRLYLERSPNQSDAIKCFRHVLELDPENLEAISALKEMYEKRRDWERLIELRKLEWPLLEPSAQLNARIETAQLATERLRRLAVCIELWQEVLDIDPTNEAALAALASLYERGRDWEPLAAVLERQAEAPLETDRMIALLTKLGSVYADKLGNDEGAISAYGRLLVLNPDDRRAQEQIKKRYVSAGAWDELEAFYESTDKWEELIRMMERAADAEGASPEVRVELLFRVARLWLEKRDKKDRAARAYERVLLIEESNCDAANALAPLYEAAGDARKLVSVNEVRLKHIEDPLERANVLRTCANLYEARLRAPERAFSCLIEAFAIDPTDEAIRMDLERVAPKAEGQQERLFDAYANAIQSASHPDDANDLRLAYGRLLAVAEMLDDAIVQYRAVYEARPDDAIAISALTELYEQTCNYTELLDMLHRAAELQDDQAERRALAYRIAALYRDRLDDADQAILAYLAIAEEFGDQEQEAHDALDALFAKQGRWVDLAESLQARIERGVQSDQDLCDLKFRLAQTYNDALQDPGAAIEALQEVLAVAPEHEGAIAMLERLLADSSLGGVAASILEPLYEERGAWAELVSVLSVSAQFAASEDARIEVLLHIGEIYVQQLGDYHNSYLTYAEALRAAPHRDEIVGRLYELAADQRRFADLVGVLLEVAQGADEPALARLMWLRAAQLQDEELGDTDGAEASYRRILEAEPLDEEVLVLLEGLFRRSERWEPLVDVLRERAALSHDVKEQEELLGQVAFIHSDMLSDAHAAISVYGEVLEINPLSANALAQLDRLFESEAMWPELADNVARQLSIGDDKPRQLELMLKLAALREARMGEVLGAVEIYREALELDPSQPAALAALERLIAKPNHQQQIAEILEPIYADAGVYDKLIGIYEIQYAHSASVDQRVGLLHRMADLHEAALQDSAAAFQCQARALAEEPANLDTQAELERLAAVLHHWEGLAQVYEAQAPLVEDVPLASSLLFKAAETRESRLGETGAAVSLYRRVLELDGRNVEAATALERLYQEEQNYEELAGVYLAKASMMDVPESKREHLFRAAALYEEILSKPMDAIAVYQRSLSMEPDDVEALDRLIALHQRQEDWPALLEAYTQKADIVEDLEQKKALYAHVGQVYEERLEQPARAIEVYQRVLELDPEDATVMARLDALYFKRGNWDELLSVLEKEAELAPDLAQALDFQYRIGALYETQLQDPYRAVEVYHEILEQLPDHAAAQAALERMITAGQEPVAAALVLEPIYRASGDVERLIVVLEVLVSHDDDPVRKVDLLQQIAELQELHLGQVDAAFDALARSLAYDVENEYTLSSLERLADALGTFEHLAAIYDEQVDHLRVDDPRASAELALRLAKIFEIQIGDVESAIARYSIVVEQDPEHLESLAALDRLYEATEQWDALVPVLKNEICTASTPDDILAFQYRLGQIYQHRLGNTDDAIAQYREVLAAAPEHEPAVRALEELLSTGHRLAEIAEILEPLYRAQEAWDKLIALANLQLPAIEATEERIVLIHRVSEIAEERASDIDVAFWWMQRAVLEDPGDEFSIREAERLAQATGSWEQLADTYAQAAENAAGGGEPAVAALIGRRLAVLYEQRLNDVQRAEETYRYVLGLVPLDEDALEALDRIYCGHGAGEALATVLRARIEGAKDLAEEVELSHRLAEVLYNEVGRTGEAIGVLHQVLDELDADHEPTIRALQNIYTATKDWSSLYACYERELRVAVGDSVRSEILGRMAHLASSELGEPQKALELLRQVLDLLGEEPAALNALGNLYAVQENWTDLVDVLEREVAVTDDDQMRIAIYGDLGRIWYEKLSRDRNALDSWERILDIDSGAADALFAIADVHRNANAHSDLIDTLHRVLECPADRVGDVRLEAVHMELGYLYATRQDQPLDAVDQYKQALELSSRNFAAMDALESLYSAHQQWEECVGVLQQRVAAYDDTESKIEVLLQIARIWEGQLEDPDGARSAYEQVLALDPVHMLAFSKLEGLHRGAQRFEELIELYIVRVENTEDLAVRVELLRKAATVYERDLSDRNQAFDALLLAWQQDFTDEPSAAALERMAGLTQRWSEVLTTANGALQLLRESGSQDECAQNAICLNCARWYSREGRPDYAMPYLQQVLSLDPVNRPALSQMADLYKQAQDWQAYGQLLTKLADITEEADEKAAVLMRIGALQEEQFQSPEAAISHYRASLDAVPGNDQALQALEAIYRKQEKWNELVDVLRQRIDVLDDPEARRVAMISLAEVYEHQLADTARAADQYSAVVEEAPESIAALKGLERLYLQSQQWPELLAVLEKQLDIVTNEREQVLLHTRIAAMWEEEFLKPDKAAAHLEEVLHIDPINSEALQALSRLYRVQRRWGDLIRTYERSVDAVDAAADRAALFGAIGAVCREQLRDSDSAIDAYLNVLENDSNSREALWALVDLYEETEEYNLALGSMERLSELLEDDASRVELFCRMGRLLGTKAGDRMSAVEYFQRATDIDGSHLASLLAMRDIHMAEGEYHAAARVLDRAVEAEGSSRKKAILRVELGRLYERHLQEHEAAIQAFEQALELDPDNVDAALPLVDEYIAAERFADAEPLLQMLVRSAGKFEEGQRQHLWFTYGECAERLGDDTTAARAFGQVFEIDSQDLTALMGLASAHYRLRDWDEAFKYYQMILVHHRDQLSLDETTDAFYRLGVIKRELGDRRKALNMFEKALEEDSGHRPTLEAMVSLHEDDEEWEQVVHFKKRILDGSDDVTERFALYSEIGALWEERLDNPASAIEAFVEASELSPDDHKMLHKLLSLYLKTAQWEAVIDVINRISVVDERSQVRAKNAYTIGVILRDELKDGAGALQHFSEALDLDPTSQLKAFEAINKILTQQKNWKELERAFRRMLRRIAGQGDQDLEFNLWHNLGVIYRDRLRDMVAAAESFAMASRLQPGNMQEHQILAEIYAAAPGRLESAIAEHQILLKHDPDDVGSYRTLFKLYFYGGAYDKAWCVAATLNHLQEADAEQQEFYEQYKTDSPIRPKSRLTDELWVKELFHPTENLLVGKIYESVAAAMLQWYKVSDKRLDLRKKQEVTDLAGTTIAFARTFGFVNQVFGFGFTPRLFVCPDRQMGLEYATTIPPASVCGSTLLSGMKPLDVIFVVARHLAFYRPEHYIRTMLQTKDQLKLVLAAAMRIAGVDIADKAVETTANELKAHGRMQPAQLEMLTKIGKRFADAGARADLKTWMRGTELTAARAGLLMCNDIGIASRMVQTLPPLGSVDLPVQERVQDLILFSVSENYFRLREALGIAIEAGD